MAELRRLGKRGSYRLGRLGAPSAAPSQPPAPRYPIWTNRHRGSLWLWGLAWLAAVLVVAAAALLGLWFMPFLAGLAAGIAARAGRWRLRVSLPAVILLGVAGWATALWWLVLHQLPEGAVAREIAALAGLPPHAPVAMVVTLLVAAIQAATGLWLGRALAPGLR